MTQSIVLYAAVGLLLCSQAHGSNLQAVQRQIRELKIRTLSSANILATLKLGSVDTSTLEELIEDAINTVNSSDISTACKTTALAELYDLNETTIEEWANCTTSTAIEQMGLVAFGTMDFVAGLLIIADEYINGFYACLTFNPFKAIPCFITYTYDAFANIFTGINLTKTFVSNIQTYVNAINDIVTGACLDLPTDSIQTILDDSTTCE